MDVYLKTAGFNSCWDCAQIEYLNLAIKRCPWAEYISYHTIISTVIKRQQVTEDL